jgi:hypothetical protein
MFLRGLLAQKADRKWIPANTLEQAFSLAAWLKLMKLGF